jgi:hypothetical protein
MIERRKKNIAMTDILQLVNALPYQLAQLVTSFAIDHHHVWRR